MCSCSILQHFLPDVAIKESIPRDYLCSTHSPLRPHWLVAILSLPDSKDRLPNQHLKSAFTYSANGVKNPQMVAGSFILQIGRYTACLLAKNKTTEPRILGIEKNILWLDYLIWEISHVHLFILWLLYHGYRRNSIIILVTGSEPIPLPAGQHPNLTKHCSQMVEYMSLLQSTQPFHKASCCRKWSLLKYEQWIYGLSYRLWIFNCTMRRIHVVWNRIMTYKALVSPLIIVLEANSHLEWVSSKENKFE